MEFIDISVGLQEGIPVWPGSAGFRRIWTARMDDGAVANVSRLDCDLHVGTHIDAPLHFISEGMAAEKVDLDALVGEAYVADAGSAQDVSADTLDSLHIPDGVRRLLLRTANSCLWKTDKGEFVKDYVALTSDAARWVVDRRISSVGIDYLSIQRFSDGPETHQVLLGAGVVIIEGLNLFHVSQGWYELICLPLKLIGAEGAPARAILRPLSRR